MILYSSPIHPGLLRVPGSLSRSGLVPEHTHSPYRTDTTHSRALQTGRLGTLDTQADLLNRALVRRDCPNIGWSVAKQPPLRLTYQLQTAVQNLRLPILCSRAEQLFEPFFRPDGGRRGRWSPVV